MKLLSRAGRVLNGMLDRISAIAGALAVAQLPGFIQHYTQRLGGHVVEARLNVSGWQRIADETAGGQLDALLGGYMADASAAVLAAGRKGITDVERAAQLERAFEALVEAPVWQRPVVFLRHLDGAIARATWGYYQPNLPFNLESLIYALAGLLAGWCLYRLLCRCCGATVRCCRRGKQGSLREALS